MSINCKKTYTVKEIGKISGVSIRTLQFYDEIDLLKPAYYGDNGYRYYQKEQLLLLQQVLFYRELGIELSIIHKILWDSKFDKVLALKGHRDRLKNESMRNEALIRTIDKTLALIEKEIPMKDEELYLGFDHKKMPEYEAWSLKRFGPEITSRWKNGVEEWIDKSKNWTKDDLEKVKTRYEEIYRKLITAIEQNLLPTSSEVQIIIGKHYQIVSQFWIPNKAAYVNLGGVYCEYDDYRKMYDRYHPKLAEFLAESMKNYAEKNLT
jgi:DNA-binding transcriptional MerR regulator